MAATSPRRPFCIWVLNSTTYEWDEVAICRDETIAKHICEMVGKSGKICLALQDLYKERVVKYKWEYPYVWAGENEIAWYPNWETVKRVQREIRQRIEQEDR